MDLRKVWFNIYSNKSIKDPHQVFGDLLQINRGTAKVIAQILKYC